MRINSQLIDGLVLIDEERPSKIAIIKVYLNDTEIGEISFNYILDDRTSFTLDVVNEETLKIMNELFTEKKQELLDWLGE